MEGDVIFEVETTACRRCLAVFREITTSSLFSRTELSGVKLLKTRQHLKTDKAIPITVRGGL
jgi:hypothetical protein